MSDLPFQEGYRLLHYFLSVISLILSYSVVIFVMNQGSTPLELLALLLFGVPEVLTLQKFVELLIFGEANQTFTAVYSL